MARLAIRPTTRGRTAEEVAAPVCRDGLAADRPGLPRRGAGAGFLDLGFAGVQNPLLVRDNASMLFGDAQARVEDILRALASLDAV
jgi:hypothetical protein